MQLHDEELIPNEFAKDEAAEPFDVGSRPEIAGLLAVIGIIWMIFGSSDGAF